jgi:membrane-bound metal-dependent hydrolase YbcI (DUF457 family)
MFIGHPATGFLAKRITPRTSLGWLVLAPFFLDILWPVFLLAGVEQVRIDPGNTAFTPLDFHHYPWSHSLVMAIVWSIVLGGIYRMMSKDSRGAWVVGGLVFSHWILDFVTHRPDLPLYPGGPKVGLGLWNSVIGTVVVEGAIFIAGVVVYSRLTRARDRIGSIGWWTLIVLLVLIYAANLFGPPPPDVKAIAFVGLLLLLFPIWAWWVDRHRLVR